MLSLHPFAPAFAIPFWPYFFPPLLRKASTDMRQILVQTVLSVAKPNAAIFCGCLCFSGSSLSLQVAAIAEHKALTDDGGTISEKEASGVWLFTDSLNC